MEYCVFIANRFMEMITYTFEYFHDAYTCFNVSTHDKTVIYASITTYNLLDDGKYEKSETIKVFERD